MADRKTDAKRKRDTRERATQKPRESKRDIGEESQKKERGREQEKIQKVLRKSSETRTEKETERKRYRGDESLKSERGHG